MGSQMIVCILLALHVRSLPISAQCMCACQVSLLSASNVAGGALLSFACWVGYAQCSSGIAYVFGNVSHCNIVLCLTKLLMPQVLLVLHLGSVVLSVLCLFLMLVVFLFLYLTSLVPSVWYLLFNGSGTLSDVSDRSAGCSCVVSR